MSDNKKAADNPSEGWQRPLDKRGTRGVSPRPPSDDHPGHTVPDPLDHARADPTARAPQDPQGDPTSDESAVGSTYGGLRNAPHADEAQAEPYLHVTAHEQRERDTDQVGEASERRDGSA